MIIIITMRSSELCYISYIHEVGQIQGFVEAPVSNFSEQSRMENWTVEPLIRVVNVYEYIINIALRRKKIFLENVKVSERSVNFVFFMTMLCCPNGPKAPSS